MNKKNKDSDLLDPGILDGGFKDAAILDGKAHFTIVEDWDSWLCGESEPKFKLSLSVPASVGERIRTALRDNPFVLSMKTHTPDPKSGQMFWDATLKFRVNGDCDTDEGVRERNASIRFVWQRLVSTLTQAVLGDAPPRPNTRPVTNLANLRH